MTLHLRDTLSDALKLHDENGLRPTSTSLDVLLAVVAAIDDTDQDHDGPGFPSERDYAANVATMLNRKYFTPKGAWA